MQKKNLLSKSILFGLIVIQAFNIQANFFETWDAFKCKLAIVGQKGRYYAPYIAVPALGALVSNFSPKLAVGGVGLYIGHSTLSGMYNVYRLKKKYERKERNEHQWHAGISQIDVLYFARWRQFNPGDDFYWTTAWQLEQDIKTVKTYFLKDLYAGKFVVINAQGKLVTSPTPDQVFVALRSELQELSKDKQLVAPLTDIHYTLSQPEEFHPNVSYTKVLWPNYNAASQVYIELDIMMKRLEKLLDIVAELRASVGGSGWPKSVSNYLFF